MHLNACFTQAASGEGERLNCKSQITPGRGLLVKEGLTEVTCGDETSLCQQGLAQEQRGLPLRLPKRSRIGHRHTGHCHSGILAQQDSVMGGHCCSRTVSPEPAALSGQAEGQAAGLG